MASVRRDENTRQMAKLESTHQQTGNNLVANAKINAASNVLCDKAIAVDIAITSRENKDNSIPGWPCVTPSHIAEHRRQLVSSR